MNSKTSLIVNIFKTKNRFVRINGIRGENSSKINFGTNKPENNIIKNVNKIRFIKSRIYT
jgi:hypothetical protein